MDESTVNGDFKSAGGLGISLEVVGEFFCAEFCIHVLHRLVSVFSVASSAAVLNVNLDSAIAEGL